MDAKWQFWIDRGGTFTDIVAKTPSGELLTRKLLSDNPEAYRDAALQGIREFLKIGPSAPIPSEYIKAVKMGTTVATNALLEKKGDATVLMISRGLKDIIEIGHQARPKTFALNIVKPALLYGSVIEAEERMLADGTVDVPLNLSAAETDLRRAFDQGYRSVAIVLMHAYLYPVHEQKLATLAHEIGFTQISASYDVSPLSKIVPRGETTVVDAYLTPVLQRYIDRVATAVNKNDEPGKLLFMQSSGGLVDAGKFRGRDAILSGPAGGIVGAVHTAKLAGFNKIIGFDMGGTSTDVTHYAGEYEKVYETEVAGVRMRVPMMNIHTVAAGGGSLLRFEDNRFRVGPESAGADPGPVCYRRGGQLAVTDINVCLGKIQTDFFPSIFGPDQDLPLDRDAALQAFEDIAQQVGDGRKPEDIAEGFLDIAIEHMAQAIKKISISRGYDVKNYILNCFGGAGGQHACLVADRLGMSRIFLHPFSGILSAYGMGLADVRVEKQFTLNEELQSVIISKVNKHSEELILNNMASLLDQGVSADDISHNVAALVRYKGTDTTIKVSLGLADEMRKDFEQIHLKRYGFKASEKKIVIDTVIVESYGGRDEFEEEKREMFSGRVIVPMATRKIHSGGEWRNTPLYQVEDLKAGDEIEGPAIIIEPNGTIVIEHDWRGYLNSYGHIILEKKESVGQAVKYSTDLDPITLEIFNNLFMSIAQQMGVVLQNTSQSVNVKERLDFSCAIFDAEGELVANAPHVPVHLGSMDSTIKVLIASNHVIHPGDVFVHNNPYNGGSHLPDITVITPVFNDQEDAVILYVASRAHHEDVGGIAPGSMSPKGKTIHEEGIVLECQKLIDRGHFLTEKIRMSLGEGPYPARNIDQNIADLMAQAAANSAGANELKKLIKIYGMDTVHAYMGYIQDCAEESVRNVIAKIENADFTYSLDTGATIKLRLSVDKEKRSAVVDFTGTTDQLGNNFNAPATITHAAVLYVFRCLMDDDIPLNAGCLKPLEIIIPEGSFINPRPPAAVVAGNVETSQAVTNALFGALGVLAASQGTMNNFTFGNEKYQYYETICSGSPAGNGFDGVAAVHTHMTNTRMTDPEIMEHRYPVKLVDFSIDRHSGGRGKWNAGDGITRRIEFLEEMECSMLSSHRDSAPFGLFGGNEGRKGRNWLSRKDGVDDDLGNCAQRKVNKGDVINIQSPTGGGYGKCNDLDDE